MNQFDSTRVHAPAAGEPVPTDDAGRLSIMVCKAFSGEIYRVNVSMYETVNEALPVIADTIAYYSPDWERIGLYNLSQDFEYLADDRFIDRGTRDGDLVV